MRIRLALTAILATTALAACDSSSSLIAPARSASLAKAGNSDAAHACQQGGWQSLAGADGTQFANQGDCVSYAAHGGTLVPRVVAPVIVSFTFDGLVNRCAESNSFNALFTATFTGGTGTITSPVGAVFSVASGAQTEAGPIAAGSYTLTVANGSASVTSTLSPLAAGGGTQSCTGGTENRVPTSIDVLFKSPVRHKGP